MTLKRKIFFTIGSIIRRTIPVHLYPIRKDKRKTTPFKLVFFCGEKGLSYLNASLISVYKYWKELPDIVIISDGTPFNKIEKQLIKWPKKIELISWEETAEYFKNNGNKELYDYASKDLWGKKFVGILYCALQSPTLYSDTDILWFSPPALKVDPNEIVLKMCQDISHCYSNEMLQELNLLEINNKAPLNAGLIYANGDFSGYKDWAALTRYLSTKPDFRTEQTSFAILNNYFNSEDYFKPTEILIKIDDELSLTFTKKVNPSIQARHYVHVKPTTFWRDFLHIFFKKGIRQ